jgi:transcriptional regulator with XRE-family HTH domain
MKSPNSVDRIVGAQVRSRRIAIGMSPKTLCDSLGSTTEQLQQWEDGTSRVGPTRLLELTKILDVNPAFFFPDSQPNRLHCVAGQSQPSRASFGSPSSLDALRLTNAFTGVKHRAFRKLVIELVETMAGMERETVN